MSFSNDLKKAARSVYDATSKSSSKLGKFGRYAAPFNLQYLARDAWRKYGKSLFAANSAGSISSYGGDVYGPTGSIVGRY